MNTISRFVAGSLVAAAVFATAPAQATQIPDGTVSGVVEDTPFVNLLTNPNSFAINAGVTFELTATGGFSGAGHKNGTMNGTLLFSDTVGAKIVQNLTDFFVFSDGSGGFFNFSVTSVTTKSLSLADDSNTIGLYILGNTYDALKGLSSTPTSLTLTFNNTNGSDYAASLSLAVPPVAPPPTVDVPEPATWALTLIGFGAMGAALRRRTRVSGVTFA